MSGKIGDLTADDDDKKLLRYYATAMYAYTSAPLHSDEEKQAEELSDKLEAELLRRLSTASQVQGAQTRCPKCQSNLVLLPANFYVQIKCKSCDFIWQCACDPIIGIPFSELAPFFSSPSAPQVKDEIGCDMHANGRVKGCTGCDWINGEQPPAAERGRQGGSK